MDLEEDPFHPKGRNKDYEAKFTIHRKPEKLLSNEDSPPAEDDLKSFREEEEKPKFLGHRNLDR